MRVTNLDERPPSLGLRLLAIVAIYLPWKLVYAAMSRLPEPAAPLELRFAWERELPRPGHAMWIYAAAVVFVIAAPLALRTLAELKRFVLAGWLIALTGLSTFWLLPTKAAFLPIDGDGLVFAIRDTMRTFDAEWLAFPSFHSAWSMLAAFAFRKRWPSLCWVWFGCAAAIGASCIMTGSHALADVFAGFVLAALAWRIAAVDTAAAHQAAFKP